MLFLEMALDRETTLTDVLHATLETVEVSALVEPYMVLSLFYDASFRMVVGWHRYLPPTFPTGFSSVAAAELSVSSGDISGHLRQFHSSLFEVAAVYLGEFVLNDVPDPLFVIGFVLEVGVAESD